MRGGGNGAREVKIIPLQSTNDSHGPNDTPKTKFRSKLKDESEPPFVKCFLRAGNIGGRLIQELKEFSNPCSAVTI